MTARPLFLMDTHALYWHRLGSPRLSEGATRVFNEALSEKATLLVHHVAIAELFWILQKHNQLDLYGPLLRDYQTIPYYRIEPMEWADLGNLATMHEIPEMHDRLQAISGNSTRRDHGDQRSVDSGLFPSEMPVVNQSRAHPAKPRQK